MPSVSSGLEEGQLLWEQDSLGMKEASTAGSSELLYVELICLFFRGNFCHCTCSRSGYCAGQGRGYGSLDGLMPGGLGSVLTSHPGFISSAQGVFSSRKAQGSGFQSSAIQGGENQERVKIGAKRNQSITLKFMHSLSSLINSTLH